MDLAFARLNQLAFGYWHAQALFALCETGVFDLLADGRKTAAELASLAQLEASGAEALLDAGVALGLLAREGGRYTTTEISARFLRSSSPESLSNWVKVMGRWVAPWSQLKRSLELGRPAQPQAPRLLEEAGYMEEFILGMHEYASRGADAVAEAIALPPQSLLVDVGGGAGTYSIALCRKYSELRAKIVDQGPVLAITQQCVTSAGLSERISITSGDYRSAALGRDVDAVLFSNVLHQESRSVGLAMLAQARSALRAGGKVIVHGHFLGEDRVSPVFVTLHNLSARALWEGGHSYSGLEMKAFIEEAGFCDVQVIPVAKSATTLIVGHEPAHGTK